MPSISWGDAFATAAEVEPEDLGDDFLRRTAPSIVSKSGEGSQISKVVQSFLADQNPQSFHSDSSEIRKKKKKSKKKKKKKATDEDNERVTEVTDSTFGASDKPKKKRKQESCIPTHNKVSKEKTGDDDNAEETSFEGRLVNGDTMVLVDKSSGKVFSGIDRDLNGDYLHIGSINSNDEIHLFPKPPMETSSDDSDEKKVTIDCQETKISPTFPYPTDPDDHCETPLVAYQHVIPLLKRIQKECGNIPSEKLMIYDPYFCDGSVVKHMASFGYPNVYNQKEDCYQIWEQEELHAKTSSSTSLLPSFDVFVTNPPYSGDHIDRLMKFVTSSTVFQSRPWCLLMPNWVHKKDYYINAIQNNGIQPFYVVPKKRYVYEPPKDFRSKKASDTHKKSSPFVSMWYIWGGTTHMNDILYQECMKRGGILANECEVARSKSSLRDLRRGGKGTKKKKNK